eukprot:gene2865-3560_t
MTTLTTTGKIFRDTFNFTGRVNWFTGHMIRTRRQLSDSLKHIDVILEIRDARAPLSTENPILNELLPKNSRKTRIIVFNKVDLSNSNLQNRIKEHFDGLNQPITFTQSSYNGKTTHINHPRHPYQVVKKAAELHLKKNPPPLTSTITFSGQQPNDFIQGRKMEINMMVVGLPNVGKSSLINSIRLGSNKSKIAKTGALPGVTRHIKGFRVSDNPPAFLVDTPGIMIPGNLENNEQAMTLALIGAINEKIVPIQSVADFLLFKLNQLGNTTYVQEICIPDGPIDEIQPILLHICNKLKMFMIGNKPDLDQAAKYFITLFREGKFGPLTLDKISQHQSITTSTPPNSTTTTTIIKENSNSNNTKNNVNLK